MKVIVLCEESQIITKAFRAGGHIAYSNDIQPCSGGYPEWHLQGDCFEVVMSNEWDIVIGHPPCTYLTNAGSCRRYNKDGTLNEDRMNKTIAARQFFIDMYNLPFKRIALENPVPWSGANLPECSQYIEPYYFGDPYTKKTGLWLKGLPPLMATLFCENPVSFVSLHRTPKQRSKFFPGVADAMAKQWGGGFYE